MYCLVWFTAREGKDSNIAHSQAAMYGPAM